MKRDGPLGALAGAVKESAVGDSLLEEGAVEAERDESLEATPLRPKSLKPIA